VALLDFYNFPLHFHKMHVGRGFGVCIKSFSLKIDNSAQSTEIKEEKENHSI
jgi:hypothetical protein